MLAGQPIILLREGTERRKGEDAIRDILHAARAMSESIRTTLGPRGMDKMLVDTAGDVVITNDGATIVRQMEVQHPAAKMLAEVARAQDLECGDGTKTSVILAGELLHRAEELLEERIHPTLIVQGYRLAAARALEELTAIGRPVGREDTEMLLTIARTAMMSKGVAAHRDYLAQLARRAVIEVVEDRGGQLRFDRRNLQMVRRTGGEVRDSELIEGHLLEQGALHSAMPKLIENARVALVEGALEVKKTEFSAEIRITDPAQLSSFLEEEARMVSGMVDAVVRSGANVLFSGKGIDEVAAEHLAKAGIYAIRRAKRSDLELLAKASGARIVARAENLGPEDLGSAGRVEERKIGDDPVTLVTGCPHARAVTLLLRGGTEHVVEEVERSMVDAVSVIGLALEDGRVVTGAGAAAIELAARLREFAPGVGGREQMAVEAFASALEVIPLTLAENAGMDKIDALIELRHRHKAGEVDVGVDVLRGKVGPMGEIAIEPIRVGRQAIAGATETAAMLLRIDDVIAAKRSAGGPTGGGPPRGGPEE